MYEFKAIMEYYRIKVIYVGKACNTLSNLQYYGRKIELCNDKVQKDDGVVGKPWWHILEWTGWCVEQHVTQVCMDFGEELEKRKIQVTKVLQDPSNFMNQRRPKILELYCNISEEGTV